MLRRLRKLTAEPAFRAHPFKVLTRAGVLGATLLAGRSPEFALTSSGERLRTPADLRYTTVTAFLLRDWVEPELRALDRLLKPGQVFIDVGANIGLFTLKAARLVGPLGRVLALEPGEVAFAQLQANLGLNAFPWARPLVCAASDADGWSRLYHVPLGNDPQAFSLIDSAGASSGEAVRTVRLDTLARDEGLQRLDLIKIDVEGAEPLVLAGALECLEQFRPTVIFECNAYINAGGASDAAMRSFALLDRAGYGFFRLVENRFHPIAAPPRAFCNVIAVHRQEPPPFA